MAGQTRPEGDASEPGGQATRRGLTESSDAGGGRPRATEGEVKLVRHYDRRAM
jgi:hypothetical protein